ncbi:ATP nucleotide 3'-pyrophosphokinase [Streptomyces sp. NBC_00102]|uniref:ATP nucleotide 3'-pyrophosphokinase n=1 Tax=Streptomyces sp. NBC_00102 TaxID=2975652 RepID=UPI0022580146|nr:ATP nucleotide 3'-pyrophosphokinase [Streptomyces sp. NBC_00102]MCX5401966.1 ATP nucleotide 3'-pyrophosphokinase [Streptomyces sp. NBC_00102]
MNISTRPVVSRAAVAVAFTAVLSLGSAAAADESQGWKGEGGLTLTADENNKVDAYISHARQAERTISVQVRTAAALSGAEIIGFDQRLKSPDSLKRKVATALVGKSGSNVDTVLAGITDAVRYTVQWQDAAYTVGVDDVSNTLDAFGNDSTKWSNTWGSANGYKGLNTGWRAPRSGQLFEIQFHTPASKHAQEATHKLYEEQRLPSTSAARKQQLQREQDAIFGAVPVPSGAESLTAPGAVRTLPAPA